MLFRVIYRDNTKDEDVNEKRIIKGFQLSGTPNLSDVQSSLPGTNEIKIGSWAYAPQNGKTFILTEDNSGNGFWMEDV